MSEYSTSNPTMSRPVPMAKPLALRPRRRRGEAEEPGEVGERAAGASSRGCDGQQLRSTHVRERRLHRIGYEVTVTNASRLRGLGPSCRSATVIIQAVDFRPTDEQRLLRQTVREFAEAEMRPHVMEWDEAQPFPMELLPKLAALGLMGIQFDEQYGGSAMSAVDYCICIEELARVCPAIALSVAAHNGLCTSHINMFGTDAQKEQYLPRLVQGEVLGAWGLTEAAPAAMRPACARTPRARATAGSSTARRTSSRTARSAA